MHAEYYTLNGNHIKEEIVYFQKMRLAVGKWVSCRPLIIKGVNWCAYNLLFQKHRLFWKLVLRRRLFNLIGYFGIDEVDLCLDSSENIEVSLLAISFWGRCKEKSVLWGLFTFTEKIPAKILIMSFLAKTLCNTSQWPISH